MSLGVYPSSLLPSHHLLLPSSHSCVSCSLTFSSYHLLRFISLTLISLSSLLPSSLTISLSRLSSLSFLLSYPLLTLIFLPFFSSPLSLSLSLVSYILPWSHSRLVYLLLGGASAMSGDSFSSISKGEFYNARNYSKYMYGELCVLHHGVNILSMQTRNLRGSSFCWAVPVSFFFLLLQFVFFLSSSLFIFPISHTFIHCS